MTIAPEGRRLLRVEARNAEVPIEKKPNWLKNTAHMGPEYTKLKSMARGKGLHTVCEEAGCPNIYECWEDREASFLIGGSVCTRRCDFCDIATGRPEPIDYDEPRKVAESVRDLDLRYATVTGVARDDFEDGAAWLYADTIRAIHEISPQTGVEILIPDFKGRPESLQMVVDAGPEVFAHNLETVPRIFKQIRPAFTYERSLDVLSYGKDRGLITKSNLILGMGETDEEIHEALCDLFDSGCDIITLTQYLRPSKLFHPIDRWVKPEQFVAYAKMAEEIGFLGVMSGPMVRSSYRSGRLWARSMNKLGREIPERLAHITDEGSTAQEASSLIAKLGR
ncbi:lipoyl synthase [Kocuria coralli]|uniref:Lipoyl synthase n=1 Tax=Kocuria coralli TaxID=1461025 RepID=A0A5J5KV34_9MICC|nr:lipoyl synthase [Kocuria coralli]KAA9393434.1 lipoyl synthase [Kocuria coralli]